ncbi:sugar transferase [Candidatus Izemoplasma sp. B36]|uniref:sugar transferase n=1 Tax=Candidatus Izemoplasma sp. B36 TaxID=3242468 RepID=UPI003557522C
MNNNMGIYDSFFKRVFDFLFSLVGLVVLLPIFLIISIFIVIDSKGNPIFKQDRIGRYKKTFRIYKFRTMVRNAKQSEELGKEVYENDFRVTRIGKILRRLKIDELPQLMNIFKGDMSFIGPRPTLYNYLSIYEDWELVKFSKRPGITGLAQVNGNIYLNRLEKSKYDKEYCESVSFIGDIKILSKTVLVVIFGERRFKS